MKQSTCVDDIRCPRCGHKFDGASAINYDMSCMSTDVVCPKCGAELDILISVEYTATLAGEGERNAKA